MAAAILAGGIAAACVTRSNTGPHVAVENIRRVELGMSREQVEQVLGAPERIESESSPDATEVMAYFRRLPHPLRYPMLWVRLRDGNVREVYGKRQDAFDSEGVYGLTADQRWETPAFATTFPTTPAPTER